MVQELLQKLFFFKSEPRICDGYAEVEIQDGLFFDQLQNIDLYPKVYFETRDNDFCLGLGKEEKPLAGFFQFYLKEYNWNPQLPVKSFSLPEKLCPQIQIQKKLDMVKLRWSLSLKSISLLNQKTSTFPILLRSQTTPSFHDWLYMFHNIQWGDLKKYVPARCQTLFLSDPLDAFPFFLKTRKDNHFNFFIQKSSQETFLGSSPERLLKIKDNLLQTEAVAGTRTKEKAKELLHSEKDLKEHEWVVQDILQKLSPVAAATHKTSEPYLYETKNLCHLKTNIEASLSYSQDRLPLLIEALSPTAAICGYPQDLALQTLQRYEMFQRGFYSAPIGYFDSNSAEIAVAIRSCYLLSENSSLSRQNSNILELYSGVGVVSESNPTQEWEELDLKIKPYLDLLK